MEKQYRQNENNTEMHTIKKKNTKIKRKTTE